MSSQSDKSDTLMCLLSVRLDGVDLAIDAPAGFDRRHDYIDLGPRLREAFGGGVQVRYGAELEIKVRWVTPPPLEAE